ncbi:PLP-dependent aminotransferase family protein [Rivihabitans pingtungensis]|uniref:aminotransferase-like domain-containing protein n=1 Tax=Rivihabitans pingtungensis TaxID=1054498 RepID=UPI002FD92389
MILDGPAPARLYQQVFRHWRDAIASGRLPAGARLPAVRELAARHNVSLTTARRVVEELHAGGWIETRPRLGLFVAQPRQPGYPSPAGQPAPVSIATLALRLFEALRDPAIAPFGSPFIDPAWLDIAGVNDHLRRAVRKFSPARGLTDLPPGHDALRQQIVRRALHHGFRLQQDELLITCGAMEALNLALKSVARPGAVVAVESPAFYGMLYAIEANGMQALEIRTDPRTGLDVDDLAQALGRHRIAACMLMPSLQNPLGAIMPAAARARLLALAGEHDFAIIEDDAYRELLPPGGSPPPLKHHDSDGRVLYCGTFAKAFSPAPRIGWLAAGRHTETALLHKLMNTLSTSIPNQMAVASYLRDSRPDRRLARLRDTLASNRARLADTVRRHFPAGSEVNTPAGGFFLWVTLPLGCDTLAHYPKALAAGVSFVPGALFSPSGRFGHCLRLNAGFALDEPVLARLAEVGRQLQAG